MKYMLRRLRPGIHHLTVILLIITAVQTIFFILNTGTRHETFQKSINAISKDICWLHWQPHARPLVVRGIPGVRKSRFHEIWTKIRTVNTLSLEESNHRVLYSSMSDVSGDGLGHAMATFNTEVATALYLGLTYTHRKAMFSSLTNNDKDAVENFFGWGYGEVSRESVQRTVCDGIGPTMYDGVYKAVRICQTCGKLRPMPHTGSPINVTKIVQMPAVVTFPNTTGCHEDYVSCRNRMKKEMLDQYPGNTLFSMTLQGCDRMGPNSKFGETAGWFYSHYWRRPSMNERSLSLNPDELSIAIHARRGDFLSPTNSKRTATPSASFIKTLSELILVVQNVGGPFSKLPVAIHVYSEGVFKHKSQGHDISRMQKIFIGTDGTPETAKQWEEGITRLLIPHFTRTPLPSLRVQLHIAEDTLKSLHDMVSADIFIGSSSGMSMHIIHSLSRGVVLLPGEVSNGPDELRHETSRFGASNYAISSGRIEYSTAHHWSAYAKDFTTTPEAKYSCENFQI